MLHALLCGRDRRGRLVLDSLRFRSLGQLATFFRSDRSVRWEWAEVERLGPDGRRHVARHDAADLRARLVSWKEQPSSN